MARQRLDGPVCLQPHKAVGTYAFTVRELSSNPLSCIVLYGLLIEHAAKTLRLSSISFWSQRL